MRARTYFELDLKPCILTYGVAPCQASLDSPGEEKCFNSRQTCQDLENFRTGHPLVESVTLTEFETDTTAHAVAMPASVEAGSLLLVLLATNSNAAVTTPAGWTVLQTQSQGIDVRGSVFAKDALGTEGGTTVDFVTGSAQEAVAQVYYIREQNWGGSISSDIAISGESPSDTDAPDPPAIDFLDSPNWGTDEKLFLTFVASDSSKGVLHNPPLFTKGVFNRTADGDATGASAYSCRMLSTAAQFDPRPYLLPATVSCVVFTIAIRTNVTDPTTLRFSMENETYDADEPYALPNIMSVDVTPGKVSLAEDLGERATLTVVFKDHPHSDTGEGYDPYLADRLYDPFEQGTHWGKFRARHQFIRGANCRLRSGFKGNALDGMETREFFVESITGPNLDGTFKIIAKDVLKFLDGDRAQAPRAARGFLQSDIGDGASALTLSPTGIGDSAYPGYCFATISNNEIIELTRNGDSAAIVRGQLNTTASAHTAGDKVQPIVRFSGRNPAYIIAELLTEYGEVPADYIPLDDWLTEISTYINNVYTATIAQPISVKKLLAELAEQIGLIIWWDDLSQRIRLRALRPITTGGVVFDEENIKEKTLQIEEQPNKRVSQVWTHFGQVDPLEEISDETNYSSVAVLIDTDAEADWGIPAIKQIFSRWITSAGRTVAESVNERIINRFRNPPRLFEFSVQRGSVGQISLADGYELESWPIQDSVGERDARPIQVISIEPRADELRIKAEEMLFSNIPEIGNHTVVYSNTLNANLLSDHDSLYTPAVSGDTVTCIIEEGATVGQSGDTALAALVIDGFAAGVTINLDVRGRIQGKGGKGGNGRGVGGGVGNPGKDGGIALYVRDPINLFISAGEIFGGGGGGAGGAGTANNGGGGGGGAGFDPGAGGSGASVSGGGGAQNGDDGTTEEGGDGGNGGNGATGAEKGGAGGDPGQDGAAVLTAAGGDAGAAIDGVSNVTVVEGPGDIRGSQV